jgi:hypothetical protein
MASIPPEPPDALVERLTALVRRELRAEDVRLIEAGGRVPSAPNVISEVLPDARQVVVTFAAPPDDRDALCRRLAILVGTFAQAIAESLRESRASRPPIAHSLQEELRALAARARAVDAIVIDAHSPVIWGSGRGTRSAIELSPELDAALQLLSQSRLELIREIQEELDVRPPLASQDVVAEDAKDAEEPVVASGVPGSDRVEKTEGEQGAALGIVQRAIDETRKLPGIAQLKKGRPLRHASGTSDFGFMAHSFASIYLLVLVFDAGFDELRAERAALDALPRIERLVLALPPQHDPPPAPMANVVRMRRPRRR